MKKSVLHFITLIFLTFLMPGIIHAQCPGCVIDMNCTSSPAQPTICPAVLPDGVAMQPYDANLSFYLPHNFTDAGTGYNVDLNQLDILSVVGLPYGLSFQTDAAPSNTYYPTSNPPTSEHGCGKICGTPIMAGNYNITVFVLAHVSVGIINQTANSSFTIPLTILQGSSANSGFTMTGPVGCAPHTTGFTSNRPSNGNPNVTYNWDFGNGNQSFAENPPAQYYGVPGLYPVSLQTQIDTLPYTLESMTVNSSSGCNTWPWVVPDYYFVLKQGSTTVYSSSTMSSDTPVTFAFSPIVMNDATYTVYIGVANGGFFGGDVQCGDVSFSGHNVGTYTVSAGSLSVTYTINHPVFNFTDIDTVKVYQSPVIDTLVVMPDDSICNGDSVMLSAVDTYGGLYQWYNDTTVLNNATQGVYYAKSSGYYWVEVSNTNGCRANSGIQPITVIDNPSKPGTWVIGNTLYTNAADADLQWYMNESLLSFAIYNSFNISASGYYYVIATNEFGCSTSSDTVYVTYSSGIAEVDDINEIQLVPNPTTGKFIVSFETSSGQAVEINITDLTGRVIYDKVYESSGKHFSREIDLSDIPQGIYMVGIIVDKSKAMTKLVKQ